MSEMYRLEVPQYGTLMELVADENDQVLEQDPELKAQLERTGELDRLSLERHGAIRLGTSRELAMICRVFAVMGMLPVGYYDLSVAGIPVHSTAFRPVDDEALRQNPFRVFTSLLRLELIADPELREEAAAILAAREIFTPRAVALTEAFEAQGGLTSDQAEEFVRETLETFRWHSDATVSAATYKRLHDAHRLIADVVSFKGPHINHLTPRTLDIDAVQAGMPARGITPKAVIEGPPRRKAAILLRQTSFKALEEPVLFIDDAGESKSGTHTARFGEIEQRGIALTSKGRKLYDQLLASVRGEVQVGASGGSARDYDQELKERFQAFPDDWATLRSEGLAYFRYSPTAAGLAAERRGGLPTTLEALIADGYVQFDPIVYEDFLPVSAAGIFQSNLGSDAQQNYAEQANRDAFEEALGRSVINELNLYSKAQNDSIEQTLSKLGFRPVVEKSVA
jgi:uncharacterized glyoxalase superfamily metalloenzyme YdcJ